MGFPRSRFQQAGATQAELDALEHDHQALPENMQAWNEQHWAGMDVEGLRQALKVRRGHGIDELPEIDGEELESPHAHLTVKQLRENAAFAGIDVPRGATKAEIVALLDEAAARASEEPDGDVVEDTDPAADEPDGEPDVEE